MINIFIKKIKENTIVKNTFILFSGQMFASLIGILNSILLIRAIGIEGNGIITLIMSYSAIFNGIFNFQSYNAVIKFGAEALEENSKIKYKQVLKQAFIQDIFTAILAFSTGYICVEFISNFMGWNTEIVFYIKIYLITILINVTGVFTGILRLHDRFIVIAKLNIKVNIFRFILFGLGVISKFSITYYVIVEIILNFISAFILIINSINALRKENCADFFRVKIDFDKEFTKFNFYNNIVSTIDLPVGQLVNFVINKFLGVKELGIYSILLKLGSIVSKITETIGQALLPELSKLIARGKINESKKIVKKIFIYANLLGILVIAILTLFSPVWFKLFMPFTKENIMLFIIYMIYIIFTSSITGVHLFFISMNFVKYNLPIVVIANIIYMVLLMILVKKLGLFGVIIALILQSIIVIVLKSVVIKNN